MNNPRFQRLALTLLAAVGFAGTDLGACSIPVTRYALDRWMADAYRIEASAAALAQEPIASDLRGADGTFLNIEAQPLVENLEKARVLYPGKANEAVELWSGVLDAEVYRAVTDSPARREIAKRVLAGESGVWVLVTSGREEADAKMARSLEAEIAEVERTAKLPVIRPDDPTSQLGPGPVLRVQFSVLRVARSEPVERYFLAMLAGPGGLSQLPAAEPFAALVFGRGRVLGAWSPEMLTGKHIQEASRFLLGACSCEAKDLNPGWDLLMRVNWDAELARIGHPGGKPLTTLAAALETVVIEPASPAVSDQRNGRVIFMLIAGCVVAVMAFVFLGRRGA